MLLQRTVVDAGILEVHLQILGEEVVQTNFIRSLGCSPFLLGAIALITGLGVQLSLDDGHDTKGIPTVGLVALGVVNRTSVVASLGSSPTL